MTDQDTGWPYWSVDIPGLNQAEAEELLTIVERTGIGNGGTAVDPAFFLTLSLDWHTVASFLRVFDAIGRSQPSLEDADKRIVANIIEVMREWVETAEEPE